MMILTNQYFSTSNSSDWNASYVHNVADLKSSITNAGIIRIVPGCRWNYKIIDLVSNTTEENLLILMLYSL